MNRPGKILQADDFNESPVGYLLSVAPLIIECQIHWNPQVCNAAQQLNGCAEKQRDTELDGRTVQD